MDSTSTGVSGAPALAKGKEPPALGPYPDDSKADNSSMVAAAVTVVIIIALLAVLAAVIVFDRRKKQQKKRKVEKALGKVKVIPAGNKQQPTTEGKPKTGTVAVAVVVSKPAESVPVEPRKKKSTAVSADLLSVDAKTAKPAADPVVGSKHSVSVSATPKSLHSRSISANDTLKASVLKVSTNAKSWKVDEPTAKSVNVTAISADPNLAAQDAGSVSIKTVDEKTLDSKSARAATLLN